MKKRLFSTLLALCLALSLLPTAALAAESNQSTEDDQTAKNQLYRVYTDDNKPTGTILTDPEPETTLEIGNSGRSVPLLLAIKDGDNYTIINSTGSWSIYYQSTDGTVTKQLGYGTSTDGVGGWHWESSGQLPGSTGKIVATKNGVSYTLPVTIGAAEVGMYTDKNADVAAPGDASVLPDRMTYTVNQSVTEVYLKPGRDNISIMADSANTRVSSDNKKIACALGDDGILTITNTTPTEQQSAWIHFHVSFDGVDQGQWVYLINFGTPVPTPGPILTLLSESREMTDDDYITSSEVPDLVASFTYNGEIYYMGPRQSYTYEYEIGTETPCNSTMNPDADKGTKCGVTYDIAFWTSPMNGEYRLVQDEALLKALIAAFDGTLELKVYALRSDDAAVPEEYPAFYIYDDNGFACLTTLELGFQLRLGFENTATWVFVATGTINGEELTAACSLTWEPFTWVMFEPDVNLSAVDRVAAINDFLKNYDVEDNFTFVISIVYGYYEGYIVVPDWDKRVNVKFVGDWGEVEDAQDVAHLYGGICSTSKTVKVSVEGVQFVGNGKSNKNSAYVKAETNGKKEYYPNYAIYGGSFGRTGGCAFIGYDIALYGCDSTYYNTFKDNNIAIYINVPVAESDGKIYDATFESNNVAIWFANVGNRAMSSFELKGNIFLDNTKDIQNDTAKNLYVPGQFFGKTVSGAIQPRKCVTDERVLYYPQAANADFKNDSAFGGYAYIYSTSWYQVDKIVIWNNFAASWPIPAEYLSGRFTIMNSNGTAALGQWNFGGSQGSQNNRPGGRI